MKDRCAGEIILAVAVVLLIGFVFGLSLLLEGCTTIKHTPYCQCDCGDYTFECGGDVQHQEIEIK